MTPAAQAHLDIKKAYRIAFYRILLLFMAAAAGRGFFAARMVADNAVLFQRALVFAMVEKNRPEVSFKRDDLRACVDFSGSGKAAAAEKQAQDNNAGQQLCNHRTLRPVQNFCGCFIIALDYLWGRAVLRLFVKIDRVFFFQFETAQALYP
jgi:hypothetical protein